MAVTARQDIHDTITYGLSGALLSAQAVYGYRETTFGGKQAVVRVIGAGSEHPPMTFQGSRSKYFVTVEIWVLQSGTGWTAQDADEALHAIARQVHDWIETNSSAQMTINYIERDHTRDDTASTVSSQTLGADNYWVEQIPLVVAVPW